MTWLGIDRRTAELRTLAAISYAFCFLAVLAPPTVLLAPLDPHQRLHDRFSIWWAKGVLLISGVRLSVDPLPPMRRGERFLVVANHQSLLDIVAIVMALQPVLPIRFVAKEANFRIPVLGWAMEKFGHVRVDPRSARRSVEGLHAAQEALATRWSLIFFPEGTRTENGEVGVFKPSAFRVAQRAGVRILPVTIRGAFEAMPRGSRGATPGATVRVRVHPPVDPPGEGRHSTAVAEECRRIIAGADLGVDGVERTTAEVQSVTR